MKSRPRGFNGKQLFLSGKSENDLVFLSAITMTASVRLKNDIETIAIMRLSGRGGVSIFPANRNERSKVNTPCIPPVGYLHLLLRVNKLASVLHQVFVSHKTHFEEMPNAYQGTNRGVAGVRPADQD